MVVMVVWGKKKGVGWGQPEMRELVGVEDLKTVVNTKGVNVG
ncbi:hypothetical protein HanIR_Chr09g0439691 [Helianthus annuus]|nr:hypothetical protein HanIR_Chr09g0439691 [Helianthus annuus]